MQGRGGEGSLLSHPADILRMLVIDHAPRRRGTIRHRLQQCLMSTPSHGIRDQLMSRTHSHHPIPDSHSGRVGMGMRDVLRSPAPCHASGAVSQC